MEKPVNIVFMGTASFAVPSLKLLLDNGYPVIAVITAPDKPAGRGRQIRYSPVKEFALEHDLHLLQPQKLNDPSFINDLKAIKPDLQIVVAFRMLPKSVWDIPPMGTFNLHSSLLPQYRGAAPINHAVINGETETGVSTFFIDEKIDTGQLIEQEKVSIGEQETAGELHDRLMIKGAELVLKTVHLIQEEGFQPVYQTSLFAEDTKLNPAPKIFREDCQIQWQQNVDKVNNFIRGLSPYPAAHCYLKLMDNSRKLLKLFRAIPICAEPSTFEGNFATDGQSYLYIKGNNGYLSILEVQLEGKKKMSIADFLRGFKAETIKMID